MSTVPANLLIRADSGPGIGIGHVMRCVALAQAWQRAGGNVTLASSALPQALRRRLFADGIDVEVLPHSAGTRQDADQTLRLFESLGCDWIVADGYSFGGEYQASLKYAGARVLLLDDYGHSGYYPCDIVLNHNLYATSETYANRDAETRLLLGGEYLLLRNEFVDWVNWQRETPERASRLLVTFGGEDPCDMTVRILRALGATDNDDLQVAVIIGSAYKGLSELKSLERSLPYRFHLVRNASNMAEWMAWADLAIAAAGVTCWEMAFMRLPVFATAVADNQTLAAHSLEERGIGCCFESREYFDAVRFANRVNELAASRRERLAMSRRGEEVIDGWGADRVVRVLCEPRIRLREASFTDTRLLWEWRNDPLTRAMSFSSEVVSYAESRAWLRTRIDSATCCILIGENASQTPIGQIRFDIENRRAEMSVIVCPAHRNRGVGATLIRLATERMLASGRVSAIDAHIKADNDASQRAFKKAGYCRIRRTQVNGVTADHFCIEAEQGVVRTVPEYGLPLPAVG